MKMSEKASNLIDGCEADRLTKDIINFIENK